MTLNPSDLGLLALRLGVGGTLAAHGAQKLFGAFGGGGIEGGYGDGEGEMEREREADDVEAGADVGGGRGDADGERAGSHGVRWLARSTAARTTRTTAAGSRRMLERMEAAVTH